MKKAKESLRSKLRRTVRDALKPQEPRPTGYVFTDEMWRTRTEHNPRLLLQDGKPCLPAEQRRNWRVPPETPPRTAAQQARAEDEQLWKSSLTLDDYEERKRVLYEKRKVEREKWIKQQPVFHIFSSLPPELRLYIWRLAIEEPTEVRLTVPIWRPAGEGGGGWYGSRWEALPLDIQAIALFPPLMLVNRESNGLASAHYQRAFRGVGGSGGVLTAYPTILHLDEQRDSLESFMLLPTHELEVVLAVTFELESFLVDRIRHEICKALDAPNLKRITIHSTELWTYNVRPRIFWALREIVKERLPISALKLIEFELILTNSNKNTTEGRWYYGTRSQYFRGSVFDY